MLKPYPLKKTLLNTLRACRREKRHEKSWDGFYRKFEDRFRGEKAEISKRLTTRYQQLLLDAKGAKGKPTFLDVGCGRGEMLGLAASLGYDTLGVDASGSMLGDRKGHKIFHADALEFLLRQENGSIRVISCLHVIEHCDPLYVYKLICESARVLSSGGALLIETPSLFSLWASARQFYLDPTHLHPYHPELVKLMMEEAGFSKVRFLEYAPVESVEKPKFDLMASDSNRSEWQKLEKWLYGPMDIAFWGER
jgi:SAM-dependent methyltransferase